MKAPESGSRSLDCPGRTALAYTRPPRRAKAEGSSLVTPGTQIQGWRPSSVRLWPSQRVTLPGPPGAGPVTPVTSNEDVLGSLLTGACGGGTSRGASGGMFVCKTGCESRREERLETGQVLCCIRNDADLLLRFATQIRCASGCCGTPRQCNR